MFRYLSYSFILIFFISCVGTDVLDDEIVSPMIMLDTTNVVLMPEGTKQIDAFYTNQYGVVESVDLEYRIADNNIATVSETGLITAIATGQTSALVTFGETRSNDIIVTVVGSLADVATIIISADKSILTVAETTSFTATALNAQNDVLVGKTFQWQSSQPSIASIDENGIVTAMANGMTEITANSEGITSAPTIISVGSNTRTAMMQGSGGYNASGTAVLMANDKGELTLTMSSDFEVSVALGTHIYLANSTSGSAVRSSGLDLGEIDGQGAQSFDVSAINSSVTLDTYQYVIALCKPASITFGFGEFE